MNATAFLVVPTYSQEVSGVVWKRLSAALLGATMALGSLVVVAPAQAKPADDPQLIIGGRQATESYPFLVHVGAGCTGILIKPDWVVTAGHCPFVTSVRIGSNNRTSGGTVAQVNRAIIHTEVDLRVLRLTAAVTQTPAPIPTSPPTIGNVVRLIGWGQTCPTLGCGSSPTIAREVDTVVTFENRCDSIDSFNEMCLGPANGGGVGGCYGDSGGPVVRQVGGRWFAYGAIVGGPEVCGTDETIAVDLAMNRQWISDSVGGGLPS